MKKLFYTLHFLLISIAVSASQYPEKVVKALQQSGKNSSELEAVLYHFRNDSVKFKAACFLIGNMNNKFSQNYNWADSLNKKILFNELDYPDFAASLLAFESLKNKVKGIHPIACKYYDRDTIKAALLIENIDQALTVWQNGPANKLTFDNFCEYLLPYRISVEPIQSWRAHYAGRFTYLRDSLAGKSPDQYSLFLRKNLAKWFQDSYGIENRKEPLSRLGALQLLHRKKGACEDIADLEVFMLRSQGIAATIDFVPFWATSTGRHWMNVWFDAQNQSHVFDAASTNNDDKLAREPAKVLRVTFSDQPGTLSSFISPEEIPDGYMQGGNYIDVTRDYWEVRDVFCNLFRTNKPVKVAYACVLNSLNWQPAFWGKANSDTVLFHDMCKGAVYLPMYYFGKKLVPAGYPVISGYKAVHTLVPDTINRQTVTITEHPQYLAFRQNKKYKLYFWNNKWQLINARITADTTKELRFDNVPRNALLLLIPEYSQRKERPFTIADDGSRQWW